MLDLRLGDWRDVLADIGDVDCLCVDPPYGMRTHAGHDAGIGRAETWPRASGSPDTGKSRRRALPYSHWTPGDVAAFVEHWSPRTRGWFCAFSCSELFPHWRAELEKAGRCTFAPVACVIRAMNVRLSGDGPSSWTVYLNVARPRGTRPNLAGEPVDFATWGALNGAYVTSREPGHIGGKPLELMAAIIRDYTRPGDLVCDPCAGMATTGIAALGAGRRFVGAEVDGKTHAAALERCALGVQQELIS